LACDSATDPATPAAPAISDVRADAGYTVTSLGVIPGEPWSEALSINDQNLVVGQSGAKAFWYRSGVLGVMPTLPGAEQTSATDVNNRDHAVGWAQVGGCSSIPIQRAVLWNRVTSTPVVIAPEICESGAAAINDADVVVGSGFFPASVEVRAFRWSAALGTTDLNPTWAVSSGATDIDAFGQVTGHACDGYRCFAIRWSPTGVVTILGVLPGGSYAYAHAIYGARIVGSSTTSPTSGFQGFQWTAGAGITPVFGFDEITGLSGKDRAVGFDVGSPGGPRYARTTRFTFGGVATTLPSLGMATSEARAVNRCGRIVGYSTDLAAQKRAVLWQPPVCD
jgi:uncharacterized membrane protein